MDKIKIKRMPPNATTTVLKLIQAAYSEEYGTRPDDLFGNCLVAARGNHILGALSVELSESKPFEIERYLNLDFSMLPFPRELSASFGRWVSLQRGLGAALAFAGVKYALDAGKIQSIGCSRQNVVNYLRRSFGLRFHSLHLRLRSKIPTAHAQFFMQEPKPVLYVWNLRDWYASLKPRVPASVEIEV
jgi:hypothetical protein